MSLSYFLYNRFIYNIYKKNFFGSIYYLLSKYLLWDFSFIFFPSYQTILREYRNKPLFVLTPTNDSINYNFPEQGHETASNTYCTNIRHSHRDSRTRHRISFLLVCTSRRVYIWTESKWFLCVWVLSTIFFLGIHLQDRDCVSLSTNATYFIARTLAIFFVVAIWTILGKVADRQLRNAIFRLARELISRTCYCVYVCDIIQHYWNDNEW